MLLHVMPNSIGHPLLCNQSVENKFFHSALNSVLAVVFASRPCVYRYLFIIITPGLILHTFAYNEDPAATKKFCYYTNAKSYALLNALLWRPHYDRKIRKAIAMFTPSLWCFAKDIAKKKKSLAH